MVYSSKTSKRAKFIFGVTVRINGSFAYSGSVHWKGNLFFQEMGFELKFFQLS